MIAKRTNTRYNNRGITKFYAFLTLKYDVTAFSIFFFVGVLGGGVFNGHEMYIRKKAQTSNLKIMYESMYETCVKVSTR